MLGICTYCKAAILLTLFLVVVLIDAKKAKPLIFSSIDSREKEKGKKETECRLSKCRQKH
jgi:hypothetical protein